MNAELEKLVLLQAQELEMRHLRAELVAAPARVAKAEAALAEAERNRAATDKAMAEEERLRREQELEVKGLQAKLTKLRRQMESAATATQITALEHEIGFAEKRIHDTEDAELASLERSERLEADKLAAEQDSLAKAETLARSRRESADLTDRNTAALKLLEAEHTALRQRIAESWLAVFDRVARARLTGLAEAAEGKCTACQMKLRPQRWNDLTGREHANEIFTCESCGRILFWDPRHDAPGEWAAGDRLTAATKAEAGGR